MDAALEVSFDHFHLRLISRISTAKCHPAVTCWSRKPNQKRSKKAIRLRDAYELPTKNLDRIAKYVAYAPWSTTVAHVYELMLKKKTEVVAIVNEFGETIGILTFEDVLDTVFNYEPSRAKRLLDQNPIHTIDDDQKWLLSGMASLRKISEFTGDQLPDSQSVTVSGVIQESIQRIAAVGDVCD